MTNNQKKLIILGAVGTGIGLSIAFRDKIGLEDFYCKLGMPRKGDIPCDQPLVAPMNGTQPTNGDGQQPTGGLRGWAEGTYEQPLVCTVRIGDDPDSEWNIYAPLTPDGNVLMDPSIDDDDIDDVWNDLWHERRPTLRFPGTTSRLDWLWYMESPAEPEGVHTLSWPERVARAEGFQWWMAPIVDSGVEEWLRDYLDLWIAKMQVSLALAPNGWGIRGHRGPRALGPWVPALAFWQAYRMLEMMGSPPPLYVMAVFNGLMRDYFNLSGDIMFGTFDFARARRSEGQFPATQLIGECIQ